MWGKPLGVKQTWPPRGMLGKVFLSTGKQSYSPLPRCHVGFSPYCYEIETESGCLKAFHVFSYVWNPYYKWLAWLDKRAKLLFKKTHTKYYFSVLSLCVHPDMVTIATGQVAGNSKDGKVTVKPSHAPPGCRFWDASMCCLNPVCLFHFWIFSPSLLMFAFGTPWPSTRFTLSGWERSTERSHAWLSPSR